MPPAVRVPTGGASRRAARHAAAARAWAMCACAILLPCAVAAGAEAGAGGAGCAAGVVFEDRDGDGLQGPGEPGLAGIRVSDGEAVVASGRDGGYRLPRRPDARQGDRPGFVFVVKPAGHAAARRADGLPDTWRAPGDCRPFALRPEPDARPPEVLLFADPQPKSATDVDYYLRDIVQPLAGRHGAGLGITLGDIVDDDPALYPAVNRATASLGVPWLHAPGNHDMDVGAAGDAQALRSFHRTYGPDTYAWEEPGASFVVMDDVVATPGRGPGYIGGLREDQFAFLRAYLAQADRGRLLVLAVHIPLFEAPGRDTFRDGDRERLFALLRPFPRLLLLSAHNHTQQHVFHDAASGWHGAAPLHEYNVGAACGAFWSGVKDAQGIPDATMADGTPNGHARLRIDAAGGYALSWHAARGQGGEAMRLHAPRVLRRGAYPAFGVFANVFMGRDDSRVDYRVDGGDWQPMKRVPAPDPWLQAENARDDQADALRGYDRSPEATPSPHLWRGRLPTDLAPGTHEVDVRVFDPWQGERRASTRYRLQDASP